VSAAAEAMAERISATCVEAMLDMGEAINASKARPTDALLDAKAKMLTARVMGVAAALAAVMRPTR
jgi:hypothetical protein